MKRDMSGNETAVSSVMGIVVMLAITLLSIGIMILYTLPAIDDMQDMAKTQKAEQAFTVFDSRTSKAALGESPLQTTSLSLMGGNVEVMGTNETYNESRIMIMMLSSNSLWHDEFYQNRNYWDAWKNYENKTDFAGISADLGKIVYTYDDRTVAYEGGGVWSKYDNSGTVMVSPPEFHFNGETLTLPIMKISGNTSVAGTTDADITVVSSNTPEIRFPNTSANSIYVNPLDIDNLIIYIKSDYYDGWGKYAETLTSTTAIYDHQNKTAILELNTLPEMGVKPLASNFKIIALNESNPAPLDNFSFYFEKIETEASDFNAVGMHVIASAGTKSIDYEFDQNYVNKITYRDEPIGIETWAHIRKNEPNFSEFTVYTEGQFIANSTFDFLNDTYFMKYDSQPGDEYSWDIDIEDDERQSLNDITQHYFKLMAQEGKIECAWYQGSNDKIDVPDSTYTLVYDGGEAIVTFLHVTTNELETTVN